jgi:prephenate dehydrogenase
MTGSTHHYGFIGLGLIGGSIARSLKTIQPDCRITAYSRSRAPLEHALSDGSIDVIADNISREYFGICDYIFLCTPVKYISSYLEQLAQCIGSNCIITDVGSVKGYVHESVEALGLTASFIGGHPMAGSEKTGYDNSDASILRGAYYFITPTKDSPDDRLTEYEGLVRAMGAIPVITDCQTHDHTVAAISHLPHLVASSLVNLVKDSDNPEQLMKLVAAGGFKDITRIASSPLKCGSRYAKPTVTQYCHSLMTTSHHCKTYEATLHSTATDTYTDCLRNQGTTVIHLGNNPYPSPKQPPPTNSRRMELVGMLSVPYARK